MTSVRVAAYAKVNLSLEVLGKRADGFHEVRTVMQSISLADELLVAPADELSLECEPRSLEREDNLALRAARALATFAGGDPGARIVLRKGIPVASGLGGASSDAAAVLVGLTHLWRLKPGRDDLSCLAATLGSDVPFFLTGGTGLAKGRGDAVEPLPDAVLGWLVMLVPPHSLSAKTAELYRLLDKDQWTTGERTERLVETLCEGRRPEDRLLGNVFESVADQAFPALAEHREAMLRAGSGAVHLSGAGPTLFSLFETEHCARKVAARLLSEGHSPRVARVIGSRESRPIPVEI